MSNPWFRLYSEMIDDESIRLLSFEDRWHYVALLCCKNSGLLDKEKDQVMLMRKLGIKLGLARAELESALLRLSEVGLITLPECQPCSWDKRQYIANRGTPASEDASDKRCYVYFIGEESTGRVKIGFSKNPWSRLANLQTGNGSKLEILCHLRTSGVSEAEIHRLLSDYSVGGEWFLNEGMVQDSITCIRLETELRVSVDRDADESEVIKLARTVKLVNHALPADHIVMMDRTTTCNDPNHLPHKELAHACILGSPEPMLFCVCAVTG